MANALHAKTHEAVIRRELLFDVGDGYDPELMYETERNLRTRLSFLRKVEVVGVRTSSGAVVYVRTWDAWTLELNATFKRTGGQNDSRFGIGDRNLFGYGKSATISYSRAGASGPLGLSNVSRTVQYNDPQFLGKRLSYGLTAGESSQSRNYSMTLGRPFYASITRWSLLGGVDYSEGRSDLYRDDEFAGPVQRRTYGASLNYGRSFEASTRRVRRATAGLFHRHDDFSNTLEQTAPWIPGDNQHTGVVLGLEYQELDFIKLRRIQKFSRDEDFNLGFGVAPSLSYAPGWRSLGATGAELTPRITLRKGFATELGQFVLFKADYGSTYVNGGNGSRLASFDAQYFCRFVPRHTVAAHFSVDHGWRLYPTEFLSLGEDNGLRGYGVGQFKGNRRMLFNAEERMFFFDNLFKLLDGGGVLFFDTGYAWMPREAFRPADLKSSVGIGLRLAATRSASNDPVRIDLAHALNDNRTRSRWTVSIQAGHVFGPN